MSEIFFTSDLHISHQPEFLWGPRGFSNVKEMNEAIVENWNKVVYYGDTVWNLGDLAMNDIDDAIKYLKRLNGTIYWILGNHDTLKKIEQITTACPNIILAEDKYATVLKMNKQSFYLSHYPTITANFDSWKKFSRNVINLHGHTHQKTNWLFPDNPFTYHVGLDSHNCTPVHIDEVLADIRNRWNGLHDQVKTIEDWYGIPGELRLEHP